MCDHRSNHMIEANLDLRLKIQRSMQTWCFGASSFVWKLEARVGSEKVSMFANARSMWLTCFSLIRIDPAIPQSVAFVGWIFACWLCGHVFKCCKHVAMHRQCRKPYPSHGSHEKLFSFFTILYVWCVLKIPSSQQTGQCEIPHHPRVPWRISVYQDESGGVCPQQSASGDISRV